MLPAPWIPLAVLALITVAVGGGAIAVGSRGAPPPEPLEEWAPPRDYVGAVRELDGWVTEADGRARRDPRSWLALESLGQAFRARAQLSGDWLDFARAEDAITRSFAVCGHGAGPFLARAQLRASLHRWQEIEPDLAAAERGFPTESERATITGLRAERDLQCGRYDQALRGYDEALTLERSMSRLFAAADARLSLGQRAAAERLLDEAEAVAPVRDPVSSAWLQLQRGVIAEDRGRFDEAQRRYERAAAILPGWWRADGRLAGIRARSGETVEAIATYHTLIKRTGNPEFMDALARLEKARGQEGEARRWVVTARTIYDGELADAPEAACGHGLEHALELEDDPQCAVTLAEMNQRLRPGGEATIKLARAYLRAGRIAQARTLVDEVLASPWDTPALHAAAAAIFAAAGDPRAATERERLAAFALPR